MPRGKQVLDPSISQSIQSRDLMLHGNAEQNLAGQHLLCYGKAAQVHGRMADGSLINHCRVVCGKYCSIQRKPKVLRMAMNRAME
jgi:hypothetical protein